MLRTLFFFQKGSLKRAKKKDLVKKQGKKRAFCAAPNFFYATGGGSPFPFYREKPPLAFLSIIRGGPLWLS